MKKLFIAATVVFFAACGQMATQVAHDEAIQGRWIIQSIENQEVQSERPAWVEFKQQRFAANAGCNSLMGAYALNKGVLEFTQMASTQMYCHDSMEQEGQFLGLLNRHLTVSFKGQTLHLSDQGETVLLLEKADQ